MKRISLFRAALMSTCGDVFITSLVIKLWNERWRDEIDKFYINFNNHCQVPSGVVGEFMRNIANDKKIVIIYHPVGISNGPPQVELLKLCNEDLILLLEDDFFIFESGIVDNYFKKIESGETDIVGSPRYTIGEVAEAAKKKYNLDYEGYGDRGFGWWPTGFFCKREDLLRTDLDFGSKKYPKGEYFKELDHTFENDDYTDTFTWTSVQLRYLGLRSIEIPSHKADPYEEDSMRNKMMNWHPTQQPFNHIHGGSLSTSIGGYLSGRVPDVSPKGALEEMESRIAFWTIALGATNGFDSLRSEYANGIDQLTKNINADGDRIAKKIEIYKNLMLV